MGGRGAALDEAGAPAGRTLLAAPEPAPPGEPPDGEGADLAAAVRAAFGVPPELCGGVEPDLARTH